MVYLSKDEKQPIVLNVGSTTAPMDQHVKVEIFGNDSINSPSYKKEDCLKAFILHGFNELRGPRSLVRPKILIRNSELLRETLCGYQEMIINEAFLFAGAMDCTFIK